LYVGLFGLLDLDIMVDGKARNHHLLGEEEEEILVLVVSGARRAFSGSLGPRLVGPCPVWDGRQKTVDLPVEPDDPDLVL